MKFYAKRLIMLILIMGVFIFGIPAAGQDSPGSIPQTLEELESRIEKVLEQNNAPGAAFVLTDRDNILWVGALGTADMESGREVTEETMFRVGSVSKSFTALTILRLQEKGLISLEDKLKDLAPETATTNPWEQTNPIRIKHLLEHTAGYDDLSLRETAHSDPDITLPEAFEYNPRSRVVRWAPGQHASYSNAGPAVAAYAAEKAAGQSFEELVQENLFSPLRMETASFFLTPTAEERLARSYQPDGVTEMPYTHIIMRPSGSINVTPGEMGNLLQMLLNHGDFQGNKVLSPDSIARFQRSETTLAAEQGLEVGFGPGSYVTPVDGFLFYGHDGGIDGFLSSYGYLPEHGLGYFCSINAPDGRAFNEILRLIRGYLTRDLENPASPAAEMTADEMQQYTGFYETFTPRQEVSRFLEVILGLTRIEIEGENLSLRPLMGGGKALIPVKDGQFRGTGEPVSTTVFIQKDDGSGWFMQGYGGPVSVNLSSIPAWKYWVRLAAAAASFLLMLSSLLFAAVWVPMKLFGKMKNAKYLSVRILPLLPALSFIGMAVVVVLSTMGGDPIQHYGRITIWSVSLFLLTLLFGLASLAGLIQSIRTWRRQEIGLGVKVHSLLVSLGNVTITLFLAFHNIIGFRTWV